MCQRLYVATSMALPPVTKSREAPYLDFHLADDRTLIRQHLPPHLPHLYLAQAHVECGCGFPSKPIVDDDIAPADRRRAPDDADLASMAALAGHIRPALGKRSSVLLYLCWMHEESEDPVGQRTATLADLSAASFMLRHRELLTITDRQS